MNEASVKQDPTWEKVKSFFQYFLDMPRDQLILKLALFFVLAFTKSRWALHAPLRLLALYMLLDHRFTTNRYLWWIVSAFHLAIIGLEWDFIDNHKFLSLYWMLSCTLSLYFTTTEERLEMLSKNARLLVGLVFALATFWKLAGGQYLDGSFLHYTFLADSRFEFAVGYLSGITRDILPANRDTIAALTRFPQTNAHAFLKSPSIIREIALAVSWWTLFIEGAVAATFLAPAKHWLARTQHVFLMAFILSTYTIVSVAGFNFILVLLGLSVLKPDQKRWGWAYLAVLLISELKQLPLFEYAFYLQRMFGK